MGGNRLTFWGAFVLMIIAAGCAALSPKPPETLYERLGGKEAIAAVVNDFVDKVGQDPRVRHLPAPERVAPLKVSLADLVCQASGGPCIYRGKEMKAAHAGMGISNAEFDAVVDDLVQTINKYKVGEREKNELLSLLAPMRTQIVEAP